MENLIRDTVREYLDQRSTLVNKITDLDPHLLNYSVKNEDIKNQIQAIDEKVNQLMFMAKDTKVQELSNDFIIKSNQTK
jgi:hypothetical protein